MQKYFQFALYLIALIGIALNLFLKIKWIGFLGYSALCISSIVQIIKMAKR